MTTAKAKDYPMTFNLTKWWGYIFATMYLLYGGVKIVLAMLDRVYTNLSEPVIFLILGFALVLVALAYRDLKRWGWYGLVTLNILIVLLGIYGIARTDHFVENGVLILISLVALGAMLARSTKSLIFGAQR